MYYSVYGRRTVSNFQHLTRNTAVSLVSYSKMLCSTVLKYAHCDTRSSPILEFRGHNDREFPPDSVPFPLVNGDAGYLHCHARTDVFRVSRSHCTPEIIHRRHLFKSRAHRSVYEGCVMQLSVPRDVTRRRASCVDEEEALDSDESVS